MNAEAILLRDSTLSDRLPSPPVSRGQSNRADLFPRGGLVYYGGSSTEVSEDDLLQESLVHLWKVRCDNPGRTKSWYLQNCRFHVQHWLAAGCSLDSPKRARADIALDRCVYVDLDQEAVVGKILRGRWFKRFQVKGRGKMVALDVSCGGIPRISTGVRRFWEVKAWDAPKARDYEKSLKKILLNLDRLNSASLEFWFGLIAKHGAALAQRIPGDSPALAIFKRILELDFDRALKCADIVFQAERNPAFMPGRFQLSLIGAIASQIQNRPQPAGLLDWTYHKIRFLLGHKKIDAGAPQTRFALIASLIALAFLVETDDEEGATRVEKVIGEALSYISDPKQEKFFLQFISDSLGQFIRQKDVPNHSYKAIVLCKHLGEDSIVWPRRGLVAVLRSLVALRGR